MPVKEVEKIIAFLTDMEIGIKSFLAAYISHTCKGVVCGSAAVANAAAFYYRKTCFLVNESNSYAVYHIIKPFETKEMVARVKAVLRRYHMPQSIGVDSSNAKCVNYPDLSINLDNYSVNYMGKNVEMPPKELELLYFLASAPNQVFTREQLLDNIWGYEYIGDTITFDVHIKRIREKIKDHAHWNIETVWGIGYKFVTK